MTTNNSVSPYDVSNWTSLQWEVYALNRVNKIDSQNVQNIQSYGILASGCASIFRDVANRIMTIAFRGSRFGPNIINDLGCASTNIRRITSPSLQQRFPSFQVHCGFVEEYAALKNLFEAELYREIQNKHDHDWRILLTGPSLGGALSTLCAADLLLNHVAIRADKIALVTFGSPRVVNLPFATWIDSAGLAINTRVEIPFDPVVTQPAINGGAYFHRGQLASIQFKNNRYEREDLSLACGEPANCIRDSIDTLLHPLRIFDPILNAPSRIVTSLGGLVVDQIASTGQAIWTLNPDFLPVINFIVVHCRKYDECSQYQQHSKTLIDAFVAQAEGSSSEAMPKMRELIDDINAMDSRGWTALTAIAANSNNLAVMEQLIDMGANVNQSIQPDGKTPLIYAIREGKSSLVELLITKGADINKPDDTWGWTPLMYAAYKGHSYLVLRLVGSRVDRTIRNKDGQTAADVARNYGFFDIERFLRSLP